MTLSTFIELAQEWNDLGWAVQEQAVKVFDDSDRMDECNSNALRMVRDRLLRRMKQCDDDELADEAKMQMDLFDSHLEEVNS